MTNIHVFDKAVGLVARINEVELDIPPKEITVSFIDKRSTKISMKPDCIRMLDSVADDVRVFNDANGLIAVPKVASVVALPVAWMICSLSTQVPVHLGLTSQESISSNALFCSRSFCRFCS